MALTQTLRDSGDASQLYQELLEHHRLHMLKGTVTKGRQIYWMIINFHKVNDSQEVVIGVEHLLMLEWKGDSKMSEFKHRWENIIRRMSDPLSDQTLQGMLVKKMRVSKKLKEDISHYDRLEQSNPEKSIGYLWNCINRAIRLQKEAQNATAQENYLKNELTSTAAPAPGPGDLKPKKSPKAKKAAKTAAPAQPEQQRGRSQTRTSKKTDAEIAKVCWFHNREGCTRDPCQFHHTNLSEADKARQIRPARSGSPAPKGVGKGKKSGEGKKGKSKGRSRTASPAASGRSPSPGGALDQRYCHKFLLGTCTWKPCKFKHLTQDQVDKINKMQQ